jgi:hypothetical protein
MSPYVLKWRESAGFLDVNTLNLYIHCTVFQAFCLTPAEAPAAVLFAVLRPYDSPLCTLKKICSLVFNIRLMRSLGGSDTWSDHI